MLAVLIFVLSLAVFVHFSISYTRSMIASSRELGLSEAVRERFATKSHLIPGAEFQYLMQLVKLCPEAADDRLQIRAVRAYFGLLNLIQGVAGLVAPRAVSWVEHERAGCAYVAALALDRRIALHCEMAEETAYHL